MLRKLLARARDLAWSERRDRETQDELAQHLELLAAEKERSGIGAAEARRQARLELGNPEAVREVLREGRTGSRLDLLLKDTGYALRLLRKRPAWSAACLLTVALGIGASTALFAVVDGVVLRPLPLPDPATLVRIYDTNPAKGIERAGVTSGNLQDWRRRTRSFRGIAGHYTMGRTLTARRRVGGRAHGPGDGGLLPRARRAGGARAHAHRGGDAPRALQLGGRARLARPGGRARPRPLAAALRRRPRSRGPHGPGRAPADAGGGRDAGGLRDARAGRAAVPAVGASRDAAARPALRVRARAARSRRDARAGRGGARRRGGRPGHGVPAHQRRLEREARAAAGRPRRRRPR